MDVDQATTRILRPGERLVMIAGNFGSGKTEVSVNFALHLAAAGHRVQIADLDLVNPYFRCREAADLMTRHAIRVVVPPGAQVWADLPIILPEIRGMLHPPDGTLTLFDVGTQDGRMRWMCATTSDTNEMISQVATGPRRCWVGVEWRRCIAWWTSRPGGWPTSGTGRTASTPRSRRRRGCDRAPWGESSAR